MTRKRRPPLNLSDVDLYTILITDHAKNRWKERAKNPEQNIRTALLDAVPYGMQLASSAMLMNLEQDVVFVLRIDRDTGLPSIRTVLTSVQARGNMETPARHLRKPHR